MENLMKMKPALFTSVSKHILSITVTLLATCLFSCSSLSQIEEPKSSEKILSDIFELEFTLGENNKNLPKEFIHDNLYGVAVNSSGNIFTFNSKVSKNYRLATNEGSTDTIRVYNKDGSANTIFKIPDMGTRNQPNPHDSYCSYSDFLTVKYSSWGLFVFDKNNNFIKVFKEDDYLPTMVFRAENRYKEIDIGKSRVIDENNFVYELEIRGNKKDDPYGDLKNAIAYDKNGNLKVLATYPDESVVFTRRINMSLAFHGELLFDVVENDKIIYMESYTDTKDSSYIIHVYNPHNDSRSTITKKYNPVKITPEEKVKAYDYLHVWYNPVEIYSRCGKNIRETKFHPSLQEIKTDGILLFAITNTKNEIGEFLTDIFDMESEKYIKSVYFSMIPDVIRDGFAYKTDFNRELPNKIKKYRVNTKVYMR
jgi:hypothetical protein